MGTLFELVGDAQALYNMATDPECDPRALDDTIEGVMGMIEQKAAAYCHVIKTLEMEEKQAEEVYREFMAKATIRKNNIKRMKDMLLYTMDALGKTELSAGEFTFKVQKNGGKEPLVITGEVPDKYKKVIYEDDNELIRKAIADGEDIEFAHLEPRGKHIVIK